MAVPPAAVISATTASQLSRLRLETTTRAPCAAMCTAMALPMPRLEPVMRATFPDRSNKDMEQLHGGHFGAHSAPRGASRESREAAPRATQYNPLMRSTLLIVLAVLAAGCAAQQAPRSPERHAANIAAAESAGYKVIHYGDR